MSDSFRPSRGDDVEQWLTRWMDSCVYEFQRGQRNKIREMLRDYQAKADTGTPLLEKIRIQETGKIPKDYREEADDSEHPHGYWEAGDY